MIPENHKWQRPIIEDIDGGLGQLGGVELCKGKRLICVNDGLEPNAAYSLDPAHVKCVLGKQISRIRALRFGDSS